MKQMFVIGGGAAGMMAAFSAARQGKQVTIYEKNEKLGKKLYITGKGRCNFTNAADMETVVQSVVTNAKFLYSAFAQLSNQDTMQLFEELGLPYKIERGNRVFPKSDHASDVTAVLERALRQLGVQIKYHAKVEEVIQKEQRFYGIRLAGETKIRQADQLVIATGGLSYPSTGANGDGYRFATQLGHHVIPCKPALVPFKTEEAFVKQLQGLSLRNISIQIYEKQSKQLLYEDFGEMLFTHFGISGPVVLRASSIIEKKRHTYPLQFVLDCKPALTTEQLDQRLIRDFNELAQKQLKNALDSLLPKKLIPVMIACAHLDPQKKVCLLTKTERQCLVQQIKSFSFLLREKCGYAEAIITKGGVSVKEISPKTMESKKIANIFFAGEVLDVDALTGGFNLQIAWSTGYVAGKGGN